MSLCPFLFCSVPSVFLIAAGLIIFILFYFILFFLFFFGGVGANKHTQIYTETNKRREVNLIYLDNANVIDELRHVECSYFRNSDAVKVINNI